jgi:hypothetical protein
MNKKIEKSPVPKKLAAKPRKDLCFKKEPWYDAAFKSMAASNKRSDEARFSMNYLPPR